LVAFTLAIQIACGISIAIEIAEWIDPTANAEIVRRLGISTFPIVGVGMAVSLLHLGRPSAGWRALVNIRHSRLSVEVLLTLLFALAAGIASYSYWSGTNGRFQLGEAVFGLAAVIASSRIYELSSRAFWKAGWVMTSFLAATMIACGLALAAILQGESPAIGTVLLGSSLLLASAVWMWVKRPALDIRSGWLWTGFAAYLLLIPPTGLLLTTWPGVGLAIPSVTALLGIVAGRFLMFGIAELEPPW
jgi:DMSO reductase anchor subunit